MKQFEVNKLFTILYHHYYELGSDSSTICEALHKAIESMVESSNPTVDAKTFIYKGRKAQEATENHSIHFGDEENILQNDLIVNLLAAIRYYTPKWVGLTDSEILAHFKSGGKP